MGDKKSNKAMSRRIPFSLTSICKVSSVIMPSVNGSSSSLMVAVDWEGTDLIWPWWVIVSVPKFSNWRGTKGEWWIVLLP